MKRVLVTATTLALCLLGPAPARAAFAPELAVGLNPPVAAGTPAVNLGMANPAVEAPIKRFTLALPPGFAAAGAPGATSCPLADLRLDGCPASSQVGIFAGELAGAAPFQGTIHKTSATSFGLYLSMLGGTIEQLVLGTVNVRRDGALDIRLERLPAVSLTALGVRLYGGSRGMVRTPPSCATYTVDGKFTSHAGELAIDRTTIPISGCSGVPAVSVENIRFSKRRFRAGGRRSGHRTIIAWWASRTVDHTNVRIERRKRSRWRRVGRLIGPAAAGENQLRWDGRLRGRRLKPGRYAVRIQPAGSAPSKRVRFRILRRR